MSPGRNDDEALSICDLRSELAAYERHAEAAKEARMCLRLLLPIVHNLLLLYSRTARIRYYIHEKENNEEKKK